MSEEPFDVSEYLPEAEEPKRRKRRKVKYIGNGRFIIGVPARDMPRSEFDALPKATQAALLGLRIMED